jgi:hypothetical protein
MAQRSSARAFRRDEVEEFDRRLRRFHESLAHKERRMLRQLITEALADADADVAGYMQMDDDELFRALATFLMERAEV